MSSTRKIQSKFEKRLQQFNTDLQENHKTALVNQCGEEPYPYLEWCLSASFSRDAVHEFIRDKPATPAQFERCIEERVKNYTAAKDRYQQCISPLVAQFNQDKENLEALGKTARETCIKLTNTNI